MENEVIIFFGKDTFTIVRVCIMSVCLSVFVCVDYKEHVCVCVCV